MAYSDSLFSIRDNSSLSRESFSMCCSSLRNLTSSAFEASCEKFFCKLKICVSKSNFMSIFCASRWSMYLFCSSVVDFNYLTVSSRATFYVKINHLTFNLGLVALLVCFNCSSFLIQSLLNQPLVCLIQLNVSTFAFLKHGLICLLLFSLAFLVSAILILLM